MRLWRLADARFAERLDGGYGLVNAGRWNPAGYPVTYCATVPSLCVLEKLVHLAPADVALRPQMMVELDLPGELPRQTVSSRDLPAGWRNEVQATREIGREWLDRGSAVLLDVPSVLVDVPGAFDRNVVISHLHAAAQSVRIVAMTPFVFDARLYLR